MNKYKPHLYVIPEDDANRQIANGFLTYHAINTRSILVSGVARGWTNVIEVFKTEYIHEVSTNKHCHVLLLLYYDGAFELRQSFIAESIPDEIKPRVFTLGSSENPEKLKAELELTYEKIGNELARQCHRNISDLWLHEKLIHNKRDVERMAATIRDVIFVDDNA